ncbi:hypothetical protein M0Q50_02455 [bacterium]|jgi:hypothetical protein|nr:hypothetical protein [bacterium]
MKTFDAFNIDEKEKLFLKLSHLDELEIKIDLINYSEHLFYFYKDNCLFYYNKKYKRFYISYFDIWKDIFYINGAYRSNIYSCMDSYINKYFGLNDVISEKFNNININNYFN